MYGRDICALLAAIVLLVPGNTIGLRAESQSQVDQPASSELLVIQGRITAIQGALVTVKTPDGYPGGPGGHAQYVLRGATYRVNVSHARIMLPDGKQADRLPLAVGDRVLVILSAPEAESTGSGSLPNVNLTYPASVIERLVESDRIVTH